MQQSATNSEFTLEQPGALALFTLDRPSARNALTRAMRGKIAAALPVLARDPQIYALVIRSAVAGAFSAGGDVREIAALVKSDLAEARRALAEEYALNWQLECFSKPTISLIDGIVMGTGVGISMYGTHRVAGEAYSFAMPETAIGFFPDDGLAHGFSRLPDSIGMYLGLTGHRIGRADAYRLGLATHCIASRHFDAICTALADAQPIDPILDGLHEDPGDGELDSRRAVIARCFSAPTVSGIFERLTAEQGPDADWAQGVCEILKARSPLALAVTHRHITEAAARDLRQTLTLDYRIAGYLAENHDFHEGVRAALIDKDGKPRWAPETLTGLTAGMIERAFEPMPGDELVLPTRQEMQAARGQ